MSNPYQNSYLADGVTTTFPYTFLILEGSDITCYYIPAGHVFDPDSQVVFNYTVTINPSPIVGGNVIFISPPAAGGTVLISREVAYNIDSNFDLPTTLWGKALDYIFLKISILFQQLSVEASLYNIHYPYNSPATEDFITEVEVLQDGQIWKRVGNAILAVTLEDPPDVSTLRSELASDVEGSDGARLIGYYNADLVPPGQTLKQVLDLLLTPSEAVSPYVLDQKHYCSKTADYEMPFGTFMICDNRAISRTTWASYFSEVGESYGPGDGTTTFNIPAGIDKSLIGSSATHPLYTSGGEINHTMTLAELVPHDHPVTDYRNNPTLSPVGEGVRPFPCDAPTANTTSSAGSGAPFNIMNPYLSQNMFVFVGKPAA